MPPSEVIEDPKAPATPAPAPDPEPTPPAPEPEVLPPEETPSAPETPAPAEPEPTEPSAADLKAKLVAAEADIARLKAGQPAAEPELVAPAPGQRVSMGQVFLTKMKPKLAEEFAAATEPAKQFETMFQTVDYMLGSILADRVDPLVVSNISLYNELAIRDLRSDAEFAAVESQVRDRLNKLDWKSRASDTVVQDLYHQMRGAKRNGTPAPTPAAPAMPADPARAALRDVAAGGGASPKPVGIRLTKEQEADYQGMVDNGIALTRAEYYAKLKSRQDQAKAAGKPIPTTYR